MKIFTIPLIDKEVRFYVGEKEWKDFLKASIKNGSTEDADEPSPPKGSGRACGRMVWLYDLKDKKVIFHELSHLVDGVIEYIHSFDSEFRAYIATWIFIEVFKWVKII
jgi:hypothetical protein